MAADGATERDHQEAAARQWAALGIKPKKAPGGDEPPECPQALLYLWGYFCEISHGLDTGGFGLSGITWTNLKAWSDLMQQMLEPWEAIALVRLGTLRVQITSEEAAKQQKK